CRRAEKPAGSAGEPAGLVDAGHSLPEGLVRRLGARDELIEIRITIDPPPLRCDKWSLVAGRLRLETKRLLDRGPHVIRSHHAAPGHDNDNQENGNTAKPADKEAEGGSRVRLS